MTSAITSRPCSQAIKGETPHVILDLGCGPGRDLRRFTAVGLDGSGELVPAAVDAIAPAGPVQA